MLQICRGQQTAELGRVGEHLHSMVASSLRLASSDQSSLPRPLRLALLPAASVRAFQHRLRSVNFDLLSSSLINPYPSLAVRLYLNRLVGRFWHMLDLRLSCVMCLVHLFNYYISVRLINVLSVMFHSPIKVTILFFYYTSILQTRYEYIQQWAAAVKLSVGFGFAIN